MILFTEYLSAVGPRVRLRNSDLYFWDFVALTWVTTANANTYISCIESAHGDGMSLYSATVIVPLGGPYAYEAYLASGEVIDFGTTALDAAISAIPTTPLLAADARLNNLDAAISAIPTTPLLAADARLDNLDVAISTRSVFAGGTVSAVTNPVTVGTNNDKTGYSLSTAGILAVWNQLTTAITFSAGSIGEKLKNLVLGTDNKILISTDVQDLSTTLAVTAKVVEDKIGYTLANIIVSSPAISDNGVGGSMGAATLDLTIEQGTDFSRRLVYKVGGLPVDLTSYTARGQIRTVPSAAEAVADFSFDFDVDRSTGVIYMSLAAADSSAIPVGDNINLTTNRLYYDVELITPANKVIRILQGRILVSPEVTKP